ncbi:hypothetical protein [Paracraurococcus ruber]|uniref:Yip1 domain-containing protein n=1 Tax=Paracraurococcus ruber TaxID=77675 RepID=A0ABS1CTP7_9PROT|nr:hypothetical protein [Paracraurococcus ruber]MBK1657854.1 hypothetical protein [Paracraurococcus ruber]TDG33537.1 hypothetical protein E2C05_03225 [Paracraurococcus ruber]
MPRPGGPPAPSTRAIIAAGLRGAFRLAQARADGLGLMDLSPDGVRRSFWAAGICLPGFLALKLLGWADDGAPAGGILRALVAELSGFAAAWAGYALLTLPLAEAQGRRADWSRFIAAWNWSNVVQYVILLAFSVPRFLGVPDFLASGFGLAAIGYALWLEWFVAKAALRIGGGPAVAFVVVDLLIGIFIGGFVGRLTG